MPDDLPDLPLTKLDELLALAEKATRGKRRTQYTQRQRLVEIDGRAGAFYVAADWCIAVGYEPPLHADAEYEAACDPDTIRALVAMAKKWADYIRVMNGPLSRRPNDCLHRFEKQTDGSEYCPLCGRTIPKEQP